MAWIGRLHGLDRRTAERRGQALLDQLQVTGKFTVDRGLFDLPEKSAPKLDDDVVVAGRSLDKLADYDRMAGVTQEDESISWADPR